MEGNERQLNAPRRDSVLLWTSIIAGPVMWAVGLQTKYALVHWACMTGKEWVLYLPAVATLLGSLASAWLGWRMLGDLDATFGEELEKVFPQLDRRRFMAISGVALSLMSALGIIGQMIPGIFIGACDA